MFSYTFHQNEGFADRLLRILVGSTLLTGSYFWLGDWSQLLTLILGVVLTVTGLVGFCPLYTVLGIKTIKKNSPQKAAKVHGVIMIIILMVVLTIEALASMFVTRKWFLEDFNHMNQFYKQTLFLTGQSKRPEAIQQYDQLVSSYDAFYGKYKTYQPYALRGDVQLLSDLEKVRNIIAETKTGVYEGDLPATHVKLEAIRPIFQDVFKRNSFSMLSMALVDFHDIMEEVIAAANNKNTAEVLTAYQKADQSLKAIEAEENGDDIKTIRTKLDAVKNLAETNQLDKLPTSANELKASFIKVYLQKG